MLGFFRTYISALNPNIYKPQVGKKLSAARRSEDMNRVVLQYVDMNAHSDNNADDRLLTTE